MSRTSGNDESRQIWDGASGPRASFGQRFAAFFLDWLILALADGILEIALKGVGELFGILLWIAYFTIFEGSPRGQTPGKSALGIRVISFDGAGPLGYGPAFIRTIGRYISAIAILLGYLWMLWDSEKQTWHDKLAHSVVVPVGAYPLPRGGRSAG